MPRPQENKLTKDLETLGFTRQESAFYLAVLRMGASDLRHISRESGLNRTSSYTVLESLIAKGAVTRGRSTSKTIVRSIEPSKLFDQQREAITRLESSLEQLRISTMATEKDAATTIYEGDEGMRRIARDILSNEKEVLVLGDGEAFLESMPDWAETYVNTRERKGIKTRILLKNTPKTKQSIPSSRLGSSSQFRLLPLGFRFSGGFDVLAKKVIFYSFDKQKLAIVIENPTITNLLKAIHHMLWELAKP